MIVNTTVKANLGINLANASQKAQWLLENQIMNDMKPYMPFVTGDFVQRTTAISASYAGTGLICAAAAPFGRFLYYGMVMVDPNTNSPWAQAGVKKVLTDRPLQFSNPMAQAEWFEAAKIEHLEEWKDLVKKAVINNV